MKQMYSAVITEEDGGYVALNPDTGVASQGTTVDESIANLQEALTLYLEEVKGKTPVLKNLF
jgi:predicted RNase H-like HicB family nuclease